MQRIAIRQIACGFEHTVILQDDNNVLVFGYNGYGQLGLGHNRDQNKPQILMKGIPIRQIACGDNHTVILQDDNDNDNHHKQVGCNDKSQLGLGHNRHQNKPIILMQNAKKIQGYNINIKWSSENHHQFSVTFRNRIHCFLLIHKRNHNNTGLKIPEFALFEIFKKV